LIKKLLLTWQEMHGVGDGEMCIPVKANPVELWSNTAVVQFTVEWQTAQFDAANCEPAVECTGLFVWFQVVKWQPEFPQSFGAIIKE
jgi:hypothetical protein